MRLTEKATYRPLNTYTKLMRAAESATGRVHRVNGDEQELLSKLCKKPGMKGG